MFINNYSKYVEKNGYVSCADLFSMVLKDEDSIETVKSMDIYNDHGWTNLWDVKVVPLDDEEGFWVLKMPQQKIIKK